MKVQRTILEFAAAILCVWAATFHTPFGSLSRWAVARLSGHSSELALTSFYHRSDLNAFHAGGQTVETPATLAVALAHASVSVFSTLAPLTLVGIPAHSKAVDVSALQQFFESNNRPNADLAVLSLLFEPALVDHAQARAGAEGRPLTLDSLRDQLPSGHTGELAIATKILTLSTGYRLQWPVTKAIRITSVFGDRKNPVTGASQFHTGVDLAVSEGTLVFATHGGRILRASEDALNGKMVLVDHGYGVRSAYCHASEILVAVGQTVAVTSPLIRSGNTGRSTGPHLHYQVNFQSQAVNPLPLFEELHGLIHAATDGRVPNDKSSADSILAAPGDDWP